MLKVLHSSDWHLGRQLDGQERYDEFTGFFDYLIRTIDERHIDILLVSGDVFDSSNPKNTATQAFADLLIRLRSSSLKHAVFIAGNHDSSSFLEILKTLGEDGKIHIFAHASTKGLVLDNQAYIMPIAFLRDRDLGLSYGENYEERQAQAIKDFFNECDKEYSENGMMLPCICMAHLFLTGSVVEKGDGVRLNVGTLSEISYTMLPKTPSYFALGHIHKSQCIAGKPNIRYCGSPLVMSFDEVNSKKTLVELCYEGSKLVSIEDLDIPSFKRLCVIKGDIQLIESEIDKLNHSPEKIYLEVVYTGCSVILEIYQNIRKLCGDNIVLVAVKVISTQANRFNSTLDLKEIEPLEVFEKKLDSQNIQKPRREALLQCFKTLLKGLEEDIENT